MRAICSGGGRTLRRVRSRAFSVIELMLAIVIMGAIIYVLYSMFNQTQKALRSNETQTDVSEKARAVMEMVSRELEQAQPTFVSMPAPDPSDPPIQEENMFGGPEMPPIVQKSDRTDILPRTNFLHNIYFYNHRTNAWIGIGYRVVDVTNGVGRLLRYETDPSLGQKPLWNQMSAEFKTKPDPEEPYVTMNYHHVADGVVHLSFTPYDANGYRLGFDTMNRVPGQYKIYRSTADGSRMFRDVEEMELANVVLVEGYPASRAENWQYATSYSFRSNALPAYIDMEVGILEPEALSQYYTMVSDENPNALSFLRSQINKVHLFRQRIPIRTAAQ